MIRSSILCSGVIPAFPPDYTEETLAIACNIQNEIIKDLDDKIKLLKREKAPDHPGPFVIRCVMKACSGPNADHYLYISKMDDRKLTLKHEAKIWKTAAGAEKALKLFGERFGYPKSYEILPSKTKE